MAQYELFPKLTVFVGTQAILREYHGLVSALQILPSKEYKRMAPRLLKASGKRLRATLEEFPEDLRTQMFDKVAKQFVVSGNHSK